MQELTVPPQATYALQIIAQRVVILAGTCALAMGCSTLDPTAKPTGKNCSLSAPPAQAGEQTGHGMFLQVFPRIANIDHGYTGCQAIFITTKDQAATLAWLVEVVDGDPVRVWSDDKSMSAKLPCRFRHGVLVAGDPEKCRETPVMLLPSMPAGCAFIHKEREICRYDSE